MDIKNRKYPFEGLIDYVFSAVIRSCESITKIINDVFFGKLRYTFEQLLESDYIVKEKTVPMFHYERIIHQHIGYIDAYRLHLINKEGTQDDEVIIFNERLLKHIENYLNLLNQLKKYTTKTSHELFEELTACISYVRSQGLTPRDISISRDEYTKLKNEGRLDDLFQPRPI